MEEIENRSILSYDPPIHISKPVILELDKEGDVEGLEGENAPKISKNDNENFNDFNRANYTTDDEALVSEREDIKAINNRNDMKKSSTGDEKLDSLIDLIFPPKVIKMRTADDETETETESISLDTDTESDLFPLNVQFESDDEDGKALFLRSNVVARSAGVKEEKYVLKQYINKNKVSREEVVELKIFFTLELEKRQARLKGLCDIRAQLYNDLFDELLRQILLNFPEMGVILNSVRNECKMKLEAYKMLAEEGLRFGIQKLVTNENAWKKENDGEISENELLEKQKIRDDLLLKIKNIKDEIEHENIRREEIKKRLQKLREKEIDYLKHHQSNLNSFLKSVSADDN